MIAALLLCLAASQDTDRSTPEKTLDAMGRALSGFMIENDKVAEVRKKLLELGEDLCTPEEKARRLEFRQSGPFPKVLGLAYEDIKKVDEKEGSLRIDLIQAIRMEVTDPATGKKSIDSRKEAVRFSFVKTESRWLIRAMLTDCRLCDAKGLCVLCDGKGIDNGAPCRACNGKKTCSTCQGRKERDETAPEFYYGLVSDKEFVYAPNVATPEAAAQSFADWLNKQVLDQSRSEIDFMGRFLVVYRSCLVPEIAKSLEEAHAKAIQEGMERFKQKLPKVESLEKKEQTATAIVRELVPPGLEVLNYKDFDHRILLKKTGDRWLIDQDQMGCACGGKDAACLECKGSGWIRR